MQPGEASPVVLVLVIGVPLVLLWALALADVLRRDDRDFPPLRSNVSPRLFWTVVLVLTSGIGSLFYYFSVMRFHPRRRR